MPDPRPHRGEVAERATRIEGARPAAVRMSADVLDAEALVLVPFPARPSSD